MSRRQFCRGSVFARNATIPARNWCFCKRIWRATATRCAPICLKGCRRLQPRPISSFIGQIEAIVASQQSELGSLEDACARRWQELLDARREKRVCEILRERAAARDTLTASRRLQSDVDELLQHSARKLGARRAIKETKLGIRQ